MAVVKILVFLGNSIAYIHSNPDLNLSYITNTSSEKETQSFSSTLSGFLGISTYVLNPFATKRFLAADATKFICGTKNLCDKTLHKEYGSCMAECHRCRCDEMCHFYGDCCPDVLFRNSPDTASSPSPYVSCSTDVWTTFRNSPNIFMVSSCPTNTDSDTAGKCERPDIQDQFQATPVSVVSSGVTYRNIFCAQCHFVANVQPWSHKVACNVTLVLGKVRSKAELWSLVTTNSECDIVTNPPSDVTPRECYHSEIDQCNITGQWFHEVSPVVENLCTSFYQPVDNFESKIGFTRYKNVFCAMCNGNLLHKISGCIRTVTFNVPFPLAVLLDFNPKPTDQPLAKDQRCRPYEFYDSFAKSCSSINCSVRRTLEDGVCKDIYSNVRFMGFIAEAILQPAEMSLPVLAQSLGRQYLGMLRDRLVDFQPVLVKYVRVEHFTRVSEVNKDVPIELIKVTSELLSDSNRTLTDMENTLLDILGGEFLYKAESSNITLFSSAVFCRSSDTLFSNFHLVTNETLLTSPAEEFPWCKKTSCLDLISFAPLGLQCPFTEFTDSRHDFIFDPSTSDLQIGNYSVQLQTNSFRFCKGILKVCLSVIANLTELLSENSTSSSDGEMQQNLALSIVSLVCTSLSLVGLFLTFLTYSVLPEHRTLPGKVMMALVFHLFWAQFLFLTTSNRTTNAVQCQVFAVLVHYFWLASFSWMLVSAYHMHTVFTHLRAVGNKTSAKRLIVYILICVIFPLTVTASCFVLHLIISDGADTGYGGHICFLNNATAIGVFFALPLGIILLLNTVFFTKTVAAIRSVPDMTEVSNISNKQHVLVCVKLSLLFGFTWILGILAASFQSDVLWYLFTVLTGSQGVMIFVGYSANRRTLNMIRVRLERYTGQTLLKPHHSVDPQQIQLSRTFRRTL